MSEDWQQSRTPSFFEFRMLYDTQKKDYLRDGEMRVAKSWVSENNPIHDKIVQ